MTNEVVMVVITAIITGSISTIGTVAALRVHIKYLSEGMDRNEKAICRAHSRIDKIPNH